MKMGYDAMTIGNHEFDFGFDNMARLFKLAVSGSMCQLHDLDATVLKDIVKTYASFWIVSALKIGVFRVGERSRKD